jgi:mRNA interferase MazF
VIQNNVFNRSRINTTVVCLLTSNLMREGAPGNVALSKGEAGLPKKCIANVSQLMTVDKTDLSEKIGTLRARRLREILAGMQGLLEPADVP